MRPGAMCSRSFVLTFLVAMPCLARAQSTSFAANVHGFVATRESYDSPDLGGHFSVDGGGGVGAALGLGARDLLFTIGYEFIGGQREQVNGTSNGRSASTQDISFGLRANLGGERRAFPWVWAELGQRTLSDSARTLQGATLSLKAGVEYHVTRSFGLELGAKVGMSEYRRLDPRHASSISIATPHAWYGRLELGLDWRPQPRPEE